MSLAGDSIDLICRPKSQVLVCYDSKVRYVFGHAYKLCTKTTWTYIMNDSMLASINTATLVAWNRQLPNVRPLMQSVWSILNTKYMYVVCRLYLSIQLYVVSVQLTLDCALKISAKSFIQVRNNSGPRQLSRITPLRILQNDDKTLPTLTQCTRSDKNQQSIPKEYHK